MKDTNSTNETEEPVPKIKEVLELMDWMEVRDSSIRLINGAIQSLAIYKATLKAAEAQIRRLNKCSNKSIAG